MPKTDANVFNDVNKCNRLDDYLADELSIFMRMHRCKQNGKQPERMRNKSSKIDAANAFKPTLATA